MILRLKHAVQYMTHRNSEDRRQIWPRVADHEEERLAGTDQSASASEQWPETRR
jgi:hypothetical protein